AAVPTPPCGTPGTAVTGGPNGRTATAGGPGLARRALRAGTATAAGSMTQPEGGTATAGEPKAARGRPCTRRLYGRAAGHGGHRGPPCGRARSSRPAVAGRRSGGRHAERLLQEVDLEKQ